MHTLPIKMKRSLLILWSLFCLSVENTIARNKSNHPLQFDQLKISMNAKAGRALFYYFVEAHRDPLKKSLALWLNGVAWSYHLKHSPWLLGGFEVPAGVGYSYSNTTSDYYNIGDKKTVDDAYTFLVNWMKKFSEYQDYDFFITSESYTGHYIPELANLIVSNNKAINSTNTKLKGVARSVQ
uniref:Carboxypeptidase n=1 Tax=Oryza brachyantha TaxID=4533 RepID=J3LPB9_ORYBR